MIKKQINIKILVGSCENKVEYYILLKHLKVLKQATFLSDRPRHSKSDLLDVCPRLFFSLESHKT